MRPRFTIYNGYIAEQRENIPAQDMNRERETVAPEGGLVAVIPREDVGNRLDRALARLYPEYSRSRLQQWIRQGQVTLDGRQPQVRERLRGGEEVVVIPALAELTAFEPEALPLSIVYEDEHILVVDKAPGMVVHPAAGNWEGTLLNALLYHDPELKTLPRAGLVHRLDKDTSGLLVVARTLQSHKHLVAQLQSREMRREYLALLQGTLVAGATVDAPIGRHPTYRTRMAVVPGGRSAVTHYRVMERFAHHTLARVRLESGRTHQIRVHMAHIRCPLVGDPVYGGRLKLQAGVRPELLTVLRGFRRQALHAATLGLIHPAAEREMAWSAAPPQDMAGLLEVLRQDAGYRPLPVAK